MRRLLLLTLLIAASLDGRTQHFNSWMRGTIAYQFNKKWRIDAEGQARRQNGLKTNNPIEQKLLYSYRHWVYYRQSESVQFGISPFAYYMLYNIIRDTNDYDKAPSREYRLSVSLDMQHRLSQNLHIFDRTAFEYRMFTKGDKILRVRNKIGMSYIFSNELVVKGSQEILLNTIGTGETRLFDHGRTSLSAEYRYAGKFSIELGYVSIMRLPTNSQKLLTENNLVNLGYVIRKNKTQ